MADDGIKRIEVEGFKSLAKKTSIDLRPLTILAGANSSGKSSIMQPLLLFKQTLEAPFDPGPLLLNGPHVRFTASEQLLSKPKAKRFSFGIFGQGASLESTFDQVKGNGLDLLSAHFNSGTDESFVERGQKGAVRNRCFFKPTSLHAASANDFLVLMGSAIHIPGLRDHAERTYAISGVGPAFPGPFDKYTASIIYSWGKNTRNLSSDLQHLGLTSGVQARRLNDVEIELLVSRTEGGKDLVSVADVGLAVSHVLPVLVGLLVAKPHQLLYIEQPEIHLHPRAQHALAKPFAEAAKRKVTTVVETHSSLFLLGIQSLIAKGELDPSLVILHWFDRNPKTGISSVTSVKPDKTGVFEDWPVDFDDVSLQANREFIKASFAKSKSK